MHNFTLPSERLSPYVKRIYEIDIPRPSTFAENRVIPMGMGTITIVLKGNPRIKGVNGIRKFPKYALGGQYFPTFSFDSDIPLLYYGIALKPTATYKLFGFYLADIQNDFISLDEVVGNEAEKLWQQLLQTESTENRLSLLNNFMLRQIPSTTEYNHLDVVIDYIYKKQGILKVKDLCDYEDISRRYLEKKFKKHIGFSPGQFIRQVRFNFTCSEITEADTDDDVDDILMTFGYYDRSHFMKKFRKYHGGDLRVLTGDQPNLFKAVFSKIMRSDSENSYHP
ncbi:helix-turn-helix domain-containing protein [Fodinibius sediminis]|uniref:AraC-type DNA-binding protein n=1 Tax=Fodinibius sediminis TaxID=1214077 RepID=A0A521F605_9BACT|nr:helix-turn-helix domain-containing protein [Fodinibius sediminis]SMO91625.1 AraC-type DNA-binding protein [Fodinibius sediminis]